MCKTPLDKHFRNEPSSKDDSELEITSPFTEGSKEERQALIAHILRIEIGRLKVRLRKQKVLYDKKTLQSQFHVNRMKRFHFRNIA